MIMQCIFAFCAIISFSVINEAPKKCLFINGVLGMAGWAVRVPGPDSRRL